MTRLNIAIQKSGRLKEGSIQLLKECGIHLDNGNDQLKAQSTNFPIDILFLRNSDIPQYVADGIAHLGILGENTLIEKNKPVETVLHLGFSKCRLSIAVPKQSDYRDLSDLNGKRIATSYPNTLRSFLQKHKLNAEIHEISGSVEIAPNIGLAEAVCDLVSSGSTLFKNGLEEKEVVLRSQACLVRSPLFPEILQPAFEALCFRIQSVLNARNYKYLLMNAPNEQIATIINILPGMKSPTVMPLAAEGWSSIHTVIQKDRFWEVIDQLKKAGAEGILINPIEKMIY